MRAGEIRLVTPEGREASNLHDAAIWLQRNQVGWPVARSAAAKVSSLKQPLEAARAEGGESSIDTAGDGEWPRGKAHSRVQLGGGKQTMLLVSICL